MLSLTEPLLPGGVILHAGPLASVATFLCSWEEQPAVAVTHTSY